MTRLQNAEGDLAQLQKEQGELETELAALANALTGARQQAATKLSEAVTRELRPLGMTNAQFDVRLTALPDHTAYGRDKVTFLLSANLGEPPAPLSNVASGGELSRVMLALNVITGSEQPTLVFDEVDAGIGGAVAETVGRLLRQLGRRRQVLAVTHLPQVAASADHHHVVAKRTVDGRPASTIRSVVGEARVAEIARMLGGEKLSSTTLAHAEEMLDTGLAAAAPATEAVAAPPTPAPPSPADRPHGEWRSPNHPRRLAGIGCVRQGLPTQEGRLHVGRQRCCSFASARTQATRGIRHTPLGGHHPRCTPTHHHLWAGATEPMPVPPLACPRPTPSGRAQPLLW